MEKDLLESLLSNIFGHLDLDQAGEKKLWEEGVPLMAKSLLIQDNLEIKSDSFSFERTELFFNDRIPKKSIEKIRRVVETAEIKEDEQKLKVFVREVLVRTTQVKSSVPAWAAGAKVEKTIGPLKQNDGRIVMLDFFKVEKLIGLYQQGNNLPVILFNASFNELKIKAINQPSIEISKSYDVVAGSVWIRADMLAGNSPSNRYAGLKVKKGKIQLSSNPILQGEKLVLGAQTNVQVQLSLDQIPKSTDPKKKHGKDAAEVKITTPEELKFSFSSTSKAQIDSCGPGEWEVYSQPSKFQYKQSAPGYNSQLGRVMIPYSCSLTEFSPLKQKSPMLEFQDSAPIKASWWAIPAAELDVNAPLEVAGCGGFVLEGKEGLKCTWKGLEGKNLKLIQPLILAENGRIGVTDLKAEGEGAFQEFEHWKDLLNPYGTSISISFTKSGSFIFNSLAEGTEMLVAFANSEIKVDRPLKVDGLAVGVKTKNSLLVLAGNDKKNLLYLIDDNILWDNKLPFDKVPKFKNIALALENALFTVTPVNGALIFGECTSDWKKITSSQTFLVFGLFSYMPTLPDPYLANLGYLARQFGQTREGVRGIKSWLVCQISQKPNNEKEEDVKVSFHFGPPSNQQTGDTAMVANSSSFGQIESQPVLETLQSTVRTGNRGLPHYEEQLQPIIQPLQSDIFALLDVSSNANQLGVSVSAARTGRVTTGFARNISDSEAQIDQSSNQLITVDGMQVFAKGASTRLFMMPQVAWEPVFNLTPPGIGKPGDPPFFFNYYPNDGGPTRLANTHQERVAIAPKPLVKFILTKYKQKQTPVLALFTLPFGLKALANLSHNNDREEIKPTLEEVRPNFSNEMEGGIQIRAKAGNNGKKFQEATQNDLPMFAGFTVQLNNVLNSGGTSTGASTLGQSVTEIFNGEFFMDQANPGRLRERGVPLSQIDFTGYGASTFSNWLSPSAAIAQTSQARFDVMLGRTGHEVIQVKSVVYPWGIRVVRTITLFRTSSGFVYRTDSGWQPETDGLFDFRYKYKDKTNPQINIITNEVTYPEVEATPYELHPGPLRGLFNISNIREDGTIADFVATDYVEKNQNHINEFGELVTNTTGNQITVGIKCVAVWFDADVEIENLVQGHKKGRAPAKKILGYVQLSPPGVPLSPNNFKSLLNLQGGLIGGDVNCIMNVNLTGQMMRISRFDFSHSVKPGNPSMEPIFVAAARGSVLLPKDGSWSMVQHETGTGEVTPLPPHIPLPLIRIGTWIPEKVVTQNSVNNNLLRLAHPLEILRNPEVDTINFGFLQSTSTQKALFLTPSFKKGIFKLLSKTPPIFSDAYKLMNSSSIFPNIGDAFSNFGTTVPLVEGVTASGAKVKAFVENNAVDGGKKVLELMSLTTKEEAGKIVDRGFKLLAGEANELLNEALAFDIPNFDPPLYLVDMDSLKIYIDYKAKPTKIDPVPYVDSKLNFDVNSFAGDLADTWKSKVNNVAMKVDLGSFKELITIKGNFDAKKGKESGYAGDDVAVPSPLDGLNMPEVEFSKELEPLIELLQMLASLSTGDYGAMMRKGLQIAMSNAGEVWEYKFEATKEIPLIRFPPEDNVYNSPQCPLRLEAGLSLGVYFNAALKVTSDPKQLLPTAGAFVQFKGGLEVMCVTVGGATIFAIGAVEVKIACDTKIGPSLLMKFGFGASISVGLPVIGNVSVTYMVGCEIYASANEISVTAFMLFKGHASLVGGLVSITIYIEASGTVKRLVSPDRTDCTASVTFGLDISICFIIDISFEETWQESRQIA